MAKDKSTKKGKQIPLKKTAMAKKKQPRKGPAPSAQHGKGNGSQKWEIDDLDNSSLEESSGEDSDARPRKKHCGKGKETVIEEEEEGEDEPQADDEPIPVDEDGDSEV